MFLSIIFLFFISSNIHRYISWMKTCVTVLTIPPLILPLTFPCNYFVCSARFGVSITSPLHTSLVEGPNDDDEEEGD